MQMAEEEGGTPLVSFCLKQRASDELTAGLCVPAPDVAVLLYTVNCLPSLPHRRHLVASALAGSFTGYLLSFAHR